MNCPCIETGLGIETRVSIETGVVVSQAMHALGDTSDGLAPHSLSIPHLRFFKVSLLSKGCLVGPCDPGSLRRSWMNWRAGGFSGSHGPESNHDGWWLRKGEERRSGEKLERTPIVSDRAKGSILLCHRLFLLSRCCRLFGESSRGPGPPRR